jgi:hypothetical protein
MSYIVGRRDKETVRPTPTERMAGKNPFAPEIALATSAQIALATKFVSLDGLLTRIRAACATWNATRLRGRNLFGVATQQNNVGKMIVGQTISQNARRLAPSPNLR